VPRVTGTSGGLRKFHPVLQLVPLFVRRSEPVGLSALRTLYNFVVWQASSTAGSSSTIFVSAMAIGLNLRLYTPSTVSVTDWLPSAPS
jgi:hypothetical protein